MPLPGLLTHTRHAQGYAGDPLKFVPARVPAHRSGCFPCLQRFAVEEQIRHFGQTPMQLFRCGFEVPGQAGRHRQAGRRRQAGSAAVWFVPQ